MAFLELSLNCLVVGLFVMAIILLLIPLPKTKDIANYAISVKFLSFTYLYLGIYCVFKSNYYPTDIFCLPFILTSSLQGLFLGISHVNMLNSRYVSLPYILKMLAPVVVLVIAVSICIGLRGYHRIDSYGYLCENLFSTEAPDVTVRIVWFLYYVGICIYLIYSFISEEYNMKYKVENYSSEFNIEAFSYIRYSFGVCLLVLATTFVVALSPSAKLCASANLVILVLYFIIGLLYIQYPKAFFVINDMEKNTEGENRTNLFNDNDQPTEADVIWQSWKTIVLNNKYYLRSGITIVQLAQLLGTNRNTLSATINKLEGKNFNTFINELRIEEAKSIMRENPTMTLADLCTRVGYSDQANFSRHFKEIAGISPVAWKNSQQIV